MPMQDVSDVLDDPDFNQTIQVTRTIKSVDDMRNDIDNILFDYLGSVTDDNGTPLLYRGCIG